MSSRFHPPIEQWQKWPTPNYIDPVTQPQYVLIFSSIIGPISIALLSARLWVGLRIQRNDGWDDWLILASMFPVLTLTIMFPLITELHRFNRHIWDVEPEYFAVQQNYVRAIYSLFALASGLIRLSILLFYRRLSSRAISTSFRWLLWITIISVGTSMVAFFITPIFLCSPAFAFWEQSDATELAEGYQYKCASEGADVVAYGIISTVQDLIIAILPMLLCWNLQLRCRQKIALYSIFVVAYMAVAIGGVRTSKSYRMLFKTDDVTWVASDTWIWFLLELHLVFVCANAPALRIFYCHFFINRRTPRIKFSWPGRRHTTDTNTTAGSVGSVSTIWAKVYFWKQHQRRSGTGYLSVPLTNTSTDMLGGVVHMNAHVDPGHEHGDGMLRPFGPEYIETIVPRNNTKQAPPDVELGRCSTLASTSGDKQQAPQAVASPASIRWPLPPNHSFTMPQRICWDRQGKYFVWTPWEKPIEVPERTSSIGKVFKR